MWDRAEDADGRDLEAAAGVSRLDIVETCFDAAGRLKPTVTPEQLRDGFTWACEFGRRPVVEFLLRHGMDPNAKLPATTGRPAYIERRGVFMTERLNLCCTRGRGSIYTIDGSI